MSTNVILDLKMTGENKMNLNEKSNNLFPVDQFD